MRLSALVPETYSKVRVKVKELIRRSQRHDIGIDKQNLSELSLLPQRDLSEGSIEVQPVHEREIDCCLIADGVDGNDKVIETLELQAEE
jgi:hypothetical protein